MHAGHDYRGTYLVDDALLEAMTRFLLAAPVHNGIYLEAMRAFQESMPGVPLVAAFETEFHRTMPEYARRYGVPQDWRTTDGVERYGFHGASHEYVAGRIPVLLERPGASLRLISCHLGGSSSVCAIHGGKSVDVTMGFSPQSGLENATRHGDLDVFAVLYMMDRYGWTTEEARTQLARVSGLAGLSGVEGGDVRDIEAAPRRVRRMHLLRSKSSPIRCGKRLALTRRRWAAWTPSPSRRHRREFRALARALPRRAGIPRDPD